MPVIHNKLPDILEKCRILFYGDSFTDLKKLKKIVITFGGSLVSAPHEATHLVSDQKWQDAWDEILEQNPTLCVVKPSWLLACETSGKLVAPQKHLIQPA
jgi:hypothetical protein